MPLGDYELNIVIKDRVSGQVLKDDKLKSKFTITQ
jgi:hypothetical protein